MGPQLGNSLEQDDKIDLDQAKRTLSIFTPEKDKASLMALTSPEELEEWLGKHPEVAKTAFNALFAGNYLKTNKYLESTEMFKKDEYLNPELQRDYEQCKKRGPQQINYQLRQILLAQNTPGNIILNSDLSGLENTQLQDYFEQLLAVLLAKYPELKDYEPKLRKRLQKLLKGNGKPTISASGNDNSGLLKN